MHRQEEEVPQSEKVVRKGKHAPTKHTLQNFTYFTLLYWICCSAILIGKRKEEKERKITLAGSGAENRTMYQFFNSIQFNLIFDRFCSEFEQ